MRFENTYNVKSIKNYHDVVCYCPLGKDYYSAKLTVDLFEPKFIPDYLESDSLVSSQSAKDFIIEDLAQTVAKFFKTETEAKIVKVTAFVENATHSPVEIEVVL